MRGVVLVAMIWMVIANTGVVRAADNGEVARRRFESGSRHYDLREYAPALEDFKEVFRLTGDPALLFNIGQCHRLLEQYADAQAAYKRFLFRSPDSPVRAEVEARIVQIQKILDQPKPAPVIDPAPPPA